MIKTDKVSVNYSRGHRDSHCGKVFPDDWGFCKHFRPSDAQTGTCEIVAGAINPLYWCTRFARATKAA